MGSIECIQHSGWTEIILRNPAYRNAISHTMWVALGDHARRIHDDENTRAVVIRGEGSDFSSGFDLGELTELSFDEVNQAFQLMENSIAEVERIPVPVIAALRGYCLGGAFELASACDFRLGDRTVRMGMPIAKIGIMLSTRFADRIIKLLGVSQAKELLLTGHLLTADHGRAVGSLNAVADSEDALNALVSQWLDDIRSLYPSAVRQAKASVADVMPAADRATPYFVDDKDFFAAIKRFQH